jgi:hypothetical protein
MWEDDKEIIDNITIFNYKWLIDRLNKEWYSHFITNEQVWEDYIEVWFPIYIDFKNKKKLLTLKRNTEKMVVYLLKNVDSTLENYTIGARHSNDRDLDYEELDWLLEQIIYIYINDWNNKEELGRNTRKYINRQCNCIWT